MCVVRIDAITGEYIDKHRLFIGDVVCAYLREVGGLKDYRFQVVSSHSDDALVFGRNSSRIEQTTWLVAIQNTLNETSSTEQKQLLSAAIADGLHRKVGVRREDVFINLIELPKENWSFSNGEAQYVDVD